MGIENCRTSVVHLLVKVIGDELVKHNASHFRESKVGNLVLEIVGRILNFAGDVGLETALGAKIVVHFIDFGLQ